MPGIFGNLTLASKALQAQQTALQVTGRNIANVNNPEYARQRVLLGERYSVQTSVGPEGTGVEVLQVQQLRDALLDRQVIRQISDKSSLDAQQSAVSNAELALGDRIDNTSNPTSITDTTSSASGLSGALDDFFNSFETLSASPAEIPNRQAAIESAQILADRLNIADARLSQLQGDLDSQLTADADRVNALLVDIARLNSEIRQSGQDMTGGAADLIDQRQSKLEELSGLVKVDLSYPAEDPDMVDVTIGGALLVTYGQTPRGPNAISYNASSAVSFNLYGYSSGAKTATINTSDAKNLRVGMVVTGSNFPFNSAGGVHPTIVKIEKGVSGTSTITFSNSATSDYSVDSAAGTTATIHGSIPGMFTVGGVDITSGITGGAMHGRYVASTGPVSSLRDNLRILAAQIATAVNDKYLTTAEVAARAAATSTGGFFVTNPSSGILEVNSSLSASNLATGPLADPSGTNTNAGDSAFVKSIADLRKKIFSESAATPDYISGRLGDYVRKTIGTLAQSLKSINSRAEEAKVMDASIRAQRDAVSGVSLDEETTNLLKYQRAYQANAKVISVLDEMLVSLISSLVR